MVQTKYQEVDEDDWHTHVVGIFRQAYDARHAAQRVLRLITQKAMGKGYQSWLGNEMYCFTRTVIDEDGDQAPVEHTFVVVTEIALQEFYPPDLDDSDEGSWWDTDDEETWLGFAQWYWDKEDGIERDGVDEEEEDEEEGDEDEDMDEEDEIEEGKGLVALRNYKALDYPEEEWDKEYPEEEWDDNVCPDAPRKKKTRRDLQDVERAKTPESPCQAKSMRDKRRIMARVLEELPDMTSELLPCKSYWKR